MKYLLDTDVFSAIARGQHEGLMRKVQAAGFASLAVSVVTEGEIRYGQACKPVPERLAQRIDALLEQLRRLPIDSTVVGPYAEVRATLRRHGRPIGPNDTWIAAHALASDMTLVTGNSREFERVPRLRVENWLL